MNRMAVFLLVSIFVVASCDTTTFNLHSRKSRMVARPSPLLFDRIVDFRNEFFSWPSSRMDFMSKGKKYYEVMDGFPYSTIKFEIKDSNNMTFYFSGYTQDLKNYNETGKVDLNSFNGSTRFYKEKEKFIWKLKMK